MKLVSFLLLLAGLCAAGCASLDIQGRANLGRHPRVFVEERLNDNLGIHRTIARELGALGYETATGPLTMMPDEAQLVVTYDARETWDFRPYLIELNVTVRPARDYNRVIATARYFRPGLTSKSPDLMVRETLEKLFPARQT